MAISFGALVLRSCQEISSRDLGQRSYIESTKLVRRDLAQTSCTQISHKHLAKRPLWQRETETERERETDRQTERERETDRQTERERQTDRQTERERQTDRQTESERERERETGRERERQSMYRYLQLLPRDLF